MSDDVIVTIYVVIDDVMRALGQPSHRLAQVSDAEVLTVATVAALYFQNHHERTLQVMVGMRYLSGRLSTSRFSRRLHALADWFRLLIDLLGPLVAQGEAFLIDSVPVPVCRRVRARRWRKVRGREYGGYCAAKQEKFFGWRLHLVCTLAGVPVAFDLLPASLHDLTPVHELTVGMTGGMSVYGDKAYNSANDEASIRADTGVRLVPQRKANMRPNQWADRLILRHQRQRVATLNSQFEKMGLQRLHARTNAGFAIKVHASVLALLCANLG
jgi:hypothetical protein